MWGGQCVLFGYIVGAIKSGRNKLSGQTGRLEELRKHMQFWHKNLYRKEKLGNKCEDIRLILKSILQEVGVFLVG